MSTPLPPPPQELIDFVMGLPEVRGTPEWRPAHGLLQPHLDMIVGMEDDWSATKVMQVPFRIVRVGDQEFEVAIHPLGQAVYYRVKGVQPPLPDGEY